MAAKHGRKRSQRTRTAVILRTYDTQFGLGLLRVEPVVRDLRDYDAPGNKQITNTDKTRKGKNIVCKFKFRKTRLLASICLSGLIGLGTFLTSDEAKAQACATGLGGAIGLSEPAAVLGLESLWIMPAMS